MIPRQPLSIASLERALSAERLEAYSRTDDRDELDAVARYLWNGALVSAIQPTLHAIEVTLRNNLFSGSTRVVGDLRPQLEYNDIECWLDAKPSLLYWKEEEDIRRAKKTFDRDKKPMTPGRLVSRLSFGFWVSLCGKPYEQGRESGPALWPEVLRHSFPFIPKRHQSRAAVYHRFRDVRDLRNRAFITNRYGTVISGGATDVCWLH